MKFLSLIVLSALLFTFSATSGLQAQDTDDLVGSKWQLAAYGAPGDETPALAGVAVTLEFAADNRAGGSGGCNTYGGSYTVDGDTIAFTGVVSTLMACAEDVMQQEQAYFAALAAAASYEQSADRLVITTGEGQQWVFARLNDLRGTQWQLAAFITPDEETPVIAGSSITLELGDDGRAVGSGGCNSYTSGYTAEGAALTFGPVASTKRACLDDGLMQQEQAYFAALEAAAGFELADDQLVITTSAGQQMVFTRVYRLADTLWELVAFGTADTETPVIAGSAITLEFAADNRVGGSGGCNTYGGSYTAEDTALTFGPVVSTERACLDDGLMQQEQAYFAALAAAASYEQSADRLVIHYGSGQRLIFARLATVPAGQ